LCSLSPVHCLLFSLLLLMIVFSCSLFSLIIEKYHNFYTPTFNYHSVSQHRKRSLPLPLPSFLNTTNGLTL
jgi:O-antigen/teichoic acid export membrane protein